MTGEVKGKLQNRELEGGGGGGRGGEGTRTGDVTPLINPTLRRRMVVVQRSQ